MCTALSQGRPRRTQAVCLSPCVELGPNSRGQDELPWASFCPDCYGRMAGASYGEGDSSPELFGAMTSPSMPIVWQMRHR